MRGAVFCMISMPFLVASSVGGRMAQICNVLDFGAVGDNTTEDTVAVQRAINHCASVGGITLLPTKHVFLLRPIHLPSNTTLRLDGTLHDLDAIHGDSSLDR